MYENEVKGDKHDMFLKTSPSLIKNIPQLTEDAVPVSNIIPEKIEAPQIPLEENVPVSQESSVNESPSAQEYKLDEIPSDKQIKIKINNNKRSLLLKIGNIGPKDPILKDLKKQDISKTINRIFIKKKGNIPKPKVIEKKRIDYLNDQWRSSECTKTNQVPPKLKKFLPNRVTEFSFNNKLHYCSYMGLIYILRRHNFDLFNAINVYTIKVLLHKYYAPYFSNKYTKKSIDFKWKKEGKTDLIEKYNNSNASLESIIMDETYSFTLTDFALLAEELKIPIVLFFQTKKNDFKLFCYEQEESTLEHYFLIRVSRGIFHIFSYKKDIAFVKDEINDDIKMAIKEQSIGSFGEYLKTRN